MRRLTLIRGIPGSGKSTLAKLLCSIQKPGYAHLQMLHYEADMFFELQQINFDPKKLNDAHEWCFQETVKALNAGCDVVVSNTFTRIWEMQTYIKLRPECTVIRCTGNFQNVHGVPPEKVQAMRDRFEDYPGEIIFGS